jgi:hypothetical protein
MKQFLKGGTLSLAVLMLISIVVVAGCSKPEPPPAGYYTGPMEKKGAAGAVGAQAPSKMGGKMGGAASIPE